MHFSAVSKLTAEQGQREGSLAISQQSCRLSALTQAALLTLSLAVVLTPFAILAVEAILQPEARGRLMASPAITVIVLSGAGTWLAIFGIPAWRATRCLRWNVEIDIQDGTAKVRHTTLFGTRTWKCPLGEFEGLSHNIRTRLTGTRHELILVHPDRERSLLIHMADTISYKETEALAARLGLSQRPSGALIHHENKPARAEIGMSETLQTQAA
jgi:hypothetical protein